MPDDDGTTGHDPPTAPPTTPPLSSGSLAGTASSGGPTSGTGDLPPYETVPAATRFGVWEVVRSIASGGYAAVYALRRTDRFLPSTAALKLTRPDLDARARDALVHEYQLAMEAHHPNVLRVFEAYDIEHGTYAGSAAFVMELADGSLYGSINAAPLGLPEADVRSAFVDVAAGLGEIHRHGWAHGDLSPSNILRFRDTTSGRDTWKIADFGSSVPIDDDKTHGILVGRKLDFRSPEHGAVFDDDLLVRQSDDVYAFGLSLHFALTGRHPFPGETPRQRWEQITLGRRDIDPSLPADLRHVIERCTELDPADRYASMEEVLTDLRTGTPPAAAPGREGATAPPFEDPASAPPMAPSAPPAVVAMTGSIDGPVDAGGRRNLVVGLAIAAALLLVVATVGWFASRASDGTTSTPTTIAPRYLSDMKPNNFPLGVSKGSVELGGQTYENSVIFRTPESSDENSASYDLDGRAARFQSTVGVSKDQSGSRTQTVEVLLDGKSAQSMTIDGDKVVQFDVDVTGKKELTLKARILGSTTASASFTDWGNARLTN